MQFTFWLYSCFAPPFPADFHRTVFHNFSPDFPWIFHLKLFFLLSFHTGKSQNDNGTCVHKAIRQTNHHFHEFLPLRFLALLHLGETLCWTALWLLYQLLTDRLWQIASLTRYFPVWYAAFVSLYHPLLFVALFFILFFALFVFFCLLGCCLVLGMEWMRWWCIDCYVFVKWMRQ